MHPDDRLECFQSHMGLWACSAAWMEQAVWALQHGAMPMRTDREMLSAQGDTLYARQDNGVAVVRVVGALTKGISKFGGASSIQVRRGIQLAMRDPEVRAILVAVDSPGGQIPGVQEVVDTIWQARAVKPVAAYIEDLAASAGYWIASAAQRVTSNATALIGNIGAYTVLTDFSGAAEREGIKVTVVSTGPDKGAGVPGTEITQRMVDDTQRLVDQFGAAFFAAVRRGRRLNDTGMTAVTDGRIWMAPDAQALGLSDGIQSFEEALAEAATLRGPRQRMARARQEVAQMRTAWEGR